MDNRTEILDLRDYAEILGRRKGSVIYAALGLAILAMLATLLGTLIGGDVYVSRLEVLIEAPSTTNGISAAIPATQRYVIRSLPVAARVARDLELDTDEDSLWRLIQRIDVETVSGEAGVIAIIAEHGSPGVAAALPSSFLDHYIEYQREQAEQRREQRSDAIRSQIADLQLRIDATAQELRNTEDELLEVEREITSAGLEMADSIEELIALLLLQQEEAAGPPALSRQREALDAQAADQRAELDEYRRQVAEYQDQLAELQSEEHAFNATVVRPTTQPVTGSLAGIVSLLGRNGFLGLILGVALGTAFAFTREWQERKFVRKRDAERILGVSLIATATGVAPDPQGALPYPLPGPDNHEYSRIRALVRAALRTPDTRPSSEASPPSLLLASPSDATASAEIAMNLAVSFAHAGSRVVLIDIGSGAGTGLSKWLNSPPGSDGLEFLQIGNAAIEASSAAEPITAETIESQLARIDADLVIVHAPPLLVSGEAIEASLVVTRVAVTPEWERTPLDDLEAAVEGLRDAGAPLWAAIAYRRTRWESHTGRSGQRVAARRTRGRNPRNDVKTSAASDRQDAATR